MVSLGGTAMFVDQTHERLDAYEKLSDVAHNPECVGWILIVPSVHFTQQTIDGMGGGPKHACIPVTHRSLTSGDRKAMGAG